MNRVAAASLCSIVSLASEQRDQKSLAQLMMLHDELVQKFDNEANETNSSLFDGLWGS